MVDVDRRKQISRGKTRQRSSSLCHGVFASPIPASASPGQAVEGQLLHYEMEQVRLGMR